MSRPDLYGWYSTLAGEEATGVTREKRAGGGPATDAGSPRRMLLAAIHARIPDTTWSGPFSRRHPEISIVALNRTDVDSGTSVTDFWVSGRPPGVWTREIAAFSDVQAVDCLAEVGDGALYRVTFDDPPIFRLYGQLEIPLPFPIRIEAGVVRWEVVARASSFYPVLRFVRGLDPSAKLVWTRTPPLRSHLPLLTASQRKLLNKAIAAGYFAVPRGITVSGLAREVGRSKSSVSEGLATIEKKLLEHALRPASLLP